MKKLGKFEVGQVWITRDNKITTITDIDETGCYPIHTNNGYSYTKEGKFSTHRTDRLDLNCLIENPKYIQPKSLDFPLIFHKGEYHVGCQIITKKDALKIFKWLGETLGYEVEG